MGAERSCQCCEHDNRPTALDPVMPSGAQSEATQLTHGNDTECMDAQILVPTPMDRRLFQEQSELNEQPEILAAAELVTDATVAGFGISRFPEYKFRCTGGIYSGQWLGKARHGFGREVWRDGVVFEGQWASDCIHGSGRVSYPNGDSYVGEWQRNQFHGLGIFRTGLENSTGSCIYIGNWSQDMRSGLGVEIFYFSDGPTNFAGCFSNDVRHGPGVSTWPDGGEFSGQWRGGVMEGYGEHGKPNGNKYRGAWHKGQRHGMGWATLQYGKTLDKGRFRFGQFIGPSLAKRSVRFAEGVG